jgi:hypothetical protein
MLVLEDFKGHLTLQESKCGMKICEREKREA